MQATITYLLTEQAQRAQMAATGQPVARKQTMAIDITGADLELLPVHDDGSISIDITQTWYRYAEALNAAGWTQRGANKFGPDFLADLKTGLGILEDRKRAEAEQMVVNGEHNRRVTEEAYQRFLANPDARPESYGSLPGIDGIRSPADWHPGDHKDFVAEVSRRRKADEDAKETATAERERAKETYIAEWVATHCTELERQQFADGLFCRKSILSAIAHEAFGTLDAETYQEVATCRDNDCPCGSKTLDCLPTAQYQAWRAIKTKLAGVTADFYRRRDCLRDEDWDGEGESATDPIIIAELTLQCGPFQFERTVILGE